MTTWELRHLVIAQQLNVCRERLLRHNRSLDTDVGHKDKVRTRFGAER